MHPFFGTFVLAIALLFALLTTWSSASAPRRFAQGLGLAIADAGGTNEIRAQYAGFFFAVGLVCALALAGVVPRQAAFIVLVTVFGGLIAGRLASLAIDGGVSGYGPAIRALYVIDATGFGLSFAAMLLER